jgi:capsular polysaccharide biosynthesis protein
MVAVMMVVVIVMMTTVYTTMIVFVMIMPCYTTTVSIGLSSESKKAHCRKDYGAPRPYRGKV